MRRLTKKERLFLEAARSGIEQMLNENRHLFKNGEQADWYHSGSTSDGKARVVIADIDDNRIYSLVLEKRR